MPGSSPCSTYPPTLQWASHFGWQYSQCHFRILVLLVDQLNAQRMFCCRNESDARKGAIIASSAAILVTLLMLMVGAGLYTWYAQYDPGEAMANYFAKDSNIIYPSWITTTLPVGLRGLILAGIFAAAISSLDSILAALSQTTLSIIKKKEELQDPDNRVQLLKLSRLLVVGWGIGLSIFAIGLDSLRGNVNMVVLAFGMISYTTGPLLGMFLAALHRKIHCSRSDPWLHPLLPFGTIYSYRLLEHTPQLQCYQRRADCICCTL